MVDATPPRRSLRRRGLPRHRRDTFRTESGSASQPPRWSRRDIQIPARPRSCRACGGVRWRHDVQDTLDLFGPQSVSRRRAIEQTSRKRRGGRPARPRAGLASMAWRSTSRPSRRVASMAWRPLRPRPSTRCRRVTSDGLGRLKFASVVLNRSTHRLSTWRGPPHRQRRPARGARASEKFCSEVVIKWH